MSCPISPVELRIETVIIAKDPQADPSIMYCDGYTERQWAFPLRILTFRLITV